MHGSKEKRPDRERRHSIVVRTDRRTLRAAVTRDVAFSLGYSRTCFIPFIGEHDREYQTTLSQQKKLISKWRKPIGEYYDTASRLVRPGDSLRLGGAATVSGGGVLELPNVSPRKSPISTKKLACAKGGVCRGTSYHLRIKGERERDRVLLFCFKIMANHHRRKSPLTAGKNGPQESSSNPLYVILSQVCPEPFFFQPNTAHKGGVHSLQRNKQTNENAPSIFLNSNPAASKLRTFCTITPLTTVLLSPKHYSAFSTLHTPAITGRLG